ncbi:hypothetical protein KCP76_05860 [Salmonella enterica subsp. enterica serovar Weltevreden]|nr:hypothetical protein KCP76_05860 [Salmonella enterica subsp. enterica serovar Weltevreden]
MAAADVLGAYCRRPYSALSLLFARLLFQTPRRVSCCGIALPQITLVLLLWFSRVMKRFSSRLAQGDTRLASIAGATV